MQKLWDFVNQYLCSALKTSLKRIFAWVRKNLEWWNKILPIYNRVIFLETSSRKVHSLYIDTCLYGLSRVYFKGAIRWENVEVDQTNAFHTVVNGKVLPINRKMAKNPRDLSINMHKVEAILWAFQTLAPKWHKKRIKLYINSTTAFSGL